MKCLITKYITKYIRRHIFAWTPFKAKGGIPLKDKLLAD